jgi:L-aminopeptidase/D-esterase-like protein
MAMAIRPSHTLYDGDTLFAVSLPAADALEPDQLALGRVAADVVAEAILSAVRAATPLHGIPSATP